MRRIIARAVQDKLQSGRKIAFLHKFEAELAKLIKIFEKYAVNSKKIAKRYCKFLQNGLE